MGSVFVLVCILVWKNKAFGNINPCGDQLGTEIFLVLIYFWNINREMKNSHGTDETRRNDATRGF